MIKPDIDRNIAFFQKLFMYIAKFNFDVFETEINFFFRLIIYLHRLVYHNNPISSEDPLCSTKAYMYHQPVDDNSFEPR